MTTAFTSTDLKGFAHLVVENGFDLLTEYGSLPAGWCSEVGVRNAVTTDYDACLRRMGVADAATRQGLVRELDAKLQSDQRVPLTFRLSPNTWATLLHRYADDLAERWPSLAA